MEEALREVVIALLQRGVAIEQVAELLKQAAPPRDDKRHTKTVRHKIAPIASVYEMHTAPNGMLKMLRQTARLIGLPMGSVGNHKNKLVKTVREGTTTWLLVPIDKVKYLAKSFPNGRRAK